MTVDLVEVRSDYGYIGRPLAFSWQGKRCEVMDILVQNHFANGYYFKVITTANEIFELDYDTNTDQWSVHQP